MSKMDSVLFGAKRSMRRMVHGAANDVTLAILEIQGASEIAYLDPDHKTMHALLDDCRAKLASASAAIAQLKAWVESG